ncbi:MAG: D-aminoacyl-tRNA deacylase [Candidatus Bilamarchaeaceae archaeon]
MPIVLFAPSNKASMCIAQKLMGRGFRKSGAKEWSLRGVRMIRCDVPTILDVPAKFETDYLLVLSTHKSKDPKPMLTAHFPGNWGKADMGGDDRYLNVAYGSKLKQIIRALHGSAKRRGLDWQVVMEADHHGPSSGIPIIYVEIGSSEKEWADERAAEAVADAVMDVLWDDPEFPSAVGFGGGHYARGFTKYMLESGGAVGHVCAKYNVDALDERMFAQAFFRNVEEVKEALVLKDELNAKQKEKIGEMCRKKGIEYREI